MAAAMAARRGRRRNALRVELHVSKETAAFVRTAARESIVRVAAWVRAKDKVRVGGMGYAMEQAHAAAMGHAP